MASEGGTLGDAFESLGVPLSHSALSTVSTRSTASASGFALAPRGWFSLKQPYFAGQFTFGTTFAIALNVPLPLVPPQAMEVELSISYRGSPHPRQFVSVWTELGQDKYLQHFVQTPGPQTSWFPIEKGRLLHLYVRGVQVSTPGPPERIKNAVYFHVTRFR